MARLRDICGAVEVADLNNPTTAERISMECANIEAMLLAKNKAYGNSATDPVRIFSRADAREQLLVRIDDKLSRIARGSEMGEDVINDLIGYLILLKIVGSRGQ